MRISEDRFTRDLRRIELAKRLLAHRVRTAWISLWTGLSGHTVRNLYCSYVKDQSSPPARKRGPAPENPLTFLRYVRLRDEGSILAALAYQFGLVPQEPVSNARRVLARLEVGEKLCQAYELFQHLLPSATFGMEQYMVLLFALAERTDLALDFCEGCQGVLLIDPLGRARRMCSRCRNEAALLVESDPSGGSPPPCDEGFQQSLF